jgi:hypothetical protein
MAWNRCKRLSQKSEGRMTDRFSDAYLKEQAEGCKSLAQLQRKVQWPDFAALRIASKRLGLNLPIIKVIREGAPRPAQPVPKPAAKAGKKKEGGE